MNDNNSNALFRTAHIIILLSYTLFSVVLAAESILMGWELWMIILIATGLAASWVVHLKQTLSSQARLWLYSVLMMATYFFYGIHLTSTYDLCPVMLSVMIIYTMTGVEALIYLCQGAYLFTFGYAIINLVRAGENFDVLLISRSFLHIMLIFIGGWVARVIIDRWRMVLDSVNRESSVLKNQIERLNDFLANISHEIRTPANAVIGLTDICVGDERDEEKRRNLKAVSAAGRKIGELVSDVLDYSEIDMGALVNNPEDYMLSSLLSDIVAGLPPEKTDGLELVIDVDPNIPSVMNSDVTKLKKILRHLIDNGLKYTREGGVYVHITPEVRDYGINLCIEVRDTGIGMSESEVEKVFDRFYQADSGRSRTTSGLGLGLSIVYGFVKSLDGFLTINSTPGKGTAVRVSLPQKVVDPGRCMNLFHPEEKRIGAYLHFDKFPNPQVRDFYNSMVRDMVTGLEVKLQRVDNIESFRELTQASSFTHIFVGREEFEEDPAFISSLAEHSLIAVIADHTFDPGPYRHPNVRIMVKPFYCFPVISLLNSNAGDAPQEQESLYVTGIKALVVDDEPMNLIVTKEILSAYGIETDTVTSGSEAIEYVATHDPDIIFMDHMMPEMDGVEAAKRIQAMKRASKKSIIMVALTANTVSTAREMFLREGFDSFLAKPLETAELEHVLKKVLPKSALTVRPVEGSDTEVSDHSGDMGRDPGSGRYAGDSPRRDKDTVWFEELRQYGVNTDKGLEYCQNDGNLYEKILTGYATESAQKIRATGEYLKERDYKNYGILVHAIKSTSRMIGASHIAEQALKLEEAAESNEGETILSLHESAMEEYAKLAAEIIRLSGVKEDEAASSTDDSLVFMEFEPV